ncbi:hypothetical protein GPECTOR_147g11 [Gonium pectorale]|uniref:Uncharacterized protein n=1 Tax=Gonium pectorale TaxID=33097 RepID=A0A150FXX3_GONPE|nr:hypothetical protein GPECTOR_147g11 [Gonium pectorale]|eukprot:KXZ42427.1 hypothetical protein GPECTOR_147g11 [Gonium pectorale]
MPNVCALPQDGRTPLRVAAFKGHQEVVKVLRATKMADVNAADKYELTPLHAAASAGHLELVKELLAKGADVNSADKGGQTPLRVAASKGHWGVVKELLESGADVEAADKGTWGLVKKLLPKKLFPSKGRLEMMKELLAEEDGRTPLHYAASKGHLEGVKGLLWVGADVHAADEVGRTSLHYAASEGHKEVVKALLKKGASVNATDEVGRTPLRVAASNGHKEVVKVLLAAGADVKAADKEPVSETSVFGVQFLAKLLKLTEANLGVYANELLDLAMEDPIEAANVILQHIKQCQPEHRLPALMLVDSMLTNDRCSPEHKAQISAAMLEQQSDRKR